MRTHSGPQALRIFVILLGVIMLGLALYSHETHADPAAIALLVTYGVILVIGTVFEQWRYKPAARLDGPDWKQTDEVFLDPVTGVKVRVWFNAGTGERDYRPVD
jgi:hypothetical protein